MNMALAGSPISESFGKLECTEINILLSFFIKTSLLLDVSVELDKTCSKIGFSLSTRSLLLSVSELIVTSFTSITRGFNLTEVFSELSSSYASASFLSLVSPSCSSLYRITTVK